MASDTSPSMEPAQHPKRRPTSSSIPVTIMTANPIENPDPHTALLQGHDHDGLADRVRHQAEGAELDNEHSHPDDGFLNKNASRQSEKMITPFLAHHIPMQYNPLGGGPRPQNATGDASTKYCYRHRPDLLCRRQADEPSMEQLQKGLDSVPKPDQQGITHVWSLFSAAPSKHRELILQGILNMCCFPQLSFISSAVRNLIKIDFVAALPPELSFKILSYLDTTSLCKAAQVSRRWRQLADDDVVWHRMCEQHIDRKCTKCGWGLPLLEQKRLRAEKRHVQLRAGMIARGWSPKISTLAELPPPMPTPETSAPNVPTGSKRPASDASLSPELVEKRARTECESQEVDQPRKRPWKEVYKDRFKVGTNWKYGRFSTKIIKGHSNGVMCLQFDDHILMTGSYDSTVKIWDIESGEEIRTLRGHAAGIRCLQYDDKYLVTGSLDNTVKIWTWRNGECVRTVPHNTGVIGLHWHNNTLATGSIDGTINVYDFATKVRTILGGDQGHTDWVNSVKMDPVSRTLFSASDDLSVKLWDLDRKVCIKTYEGHVAQIQQVLLLSPEFEIDEAEYVSNNNYDNSDAASTSTLQEASTSPPPEAASAPFFPRDPDRPAPPSYMLTASLDNTICLWHVQSGRRIHQFFGHVEGVWAVAMDTLRLVSGSQDKTVKVWDPRTGKHERTLTGHTGPVTCIGLSDSRLVSGSEDGTVRVHSFVGEEKKNGTTLPILTGTEVSSSQGS